MDDQIESSKIETWLADYSPQSSSHADSSSNSTSSSQYKEFSAVWQKLEREGEAELRAEISKSSQEPSHGTDTTGAGVERQSSDFYENLMKDGTLLDTSKPVVVEIIKKRQNRNSGSVSANQAKHQMLISSPGMVKSNSAGEISMTEGWKTHFLGKQERVSTNSNDDSDHSNGDVTVIDYLTELEAIESSTFRDDKCRFFAIDRNPSSTDSESQEIALIRDVFERSQVAILNTAEIVNINSSIEEANDAKVPWMHGALPRDSASRESYESSHTAPSTPREGNTSSNTSATTAKEIPTPLIPLESRHSSDSMKPGHIRNRGIILLEHTSANEARARAVPHPNLVVPIKVLEGPKHIFLLMPYHRYNLETVFRFSPGVLDTEAKRTFIAYQLLRTLQWLHDAGMVHGDLRPHNVKLTERLWLMLSGGQYATRPMNSSSPGLGTGSMVDSPLQTQRRRYSKPMSKAHSRVNSSSSLGGSKSLEPPNLMSSQVSSSLVSLTTMVPSSQIRVDRYIATIEWVEGNMSNFDYLMKLNEWAGRRTGDPNFHPVMPWVIDFTSPTSWRDLTKTKFRLNKGDEQLDFTYNNPIPVSMMTGSSKNGGTTNASNLISSQVSRSQPNSSGVRAEQTSSPCHINDTLTELTYYNYFARRTPLCLLKKFVRTNFVPAEYPSSMERLYQWSPDECIPEFYADPSIFVSLNPELPDLSVPHWAGGDVRKFLTLHREALEHEHVSRLLHQWIDLTFGHKLSGEAGKQAKNVALMDKNSHRNHGFVQLFVMPHPPRRRLTPVLPGSSSTNPNSTSKSLSWSIPSTQTSTIPQPIIPPNPSILIGSASGVTSSFTTPSSTFESHAGSRDKSARKTQRQTTAFGSNPLNQLPNSLLNNAPPLTPFAQLPKIVINRPSPQSSALASSTSQVSLNAGNSSNNSTAPSSATSTLKDQTSTSKDQSPTSTSQPQSTPNFSTSSASNSNPDIDSAVLGANSTQGSNHTSTPPQSSSPSISKASTSSNSNKSQTDTPTKSSPTTIEAIPSSISSQSSLQRRMSADGVETPEELHDVETTSTFGNESTLSDDTYASRGSTLFHMSSEAITRPPISPVSSSPAGDDLETYQAQAALQPSQQSGAQISEKISSTAIPPSPVANIVVQLDKTPQHDLVSSASVIEKGHSTPLTPIAFSPPSSQATSPSSMATSPTNMTNSPLLEPIPAPKPKLSNSAGAMSATPPDVTSTSRAASLAAVASADSRRGSNPLPVGAGTAKPGSPKDKDRPDKEKEKTSLRKEFLKFFGTISDAMLDKKPTSGTGPQQTSTPGYANMTSSTSQTSMTSNPQYSNINNASGGGNSSAMLMDPKIGEPGRRTLRDGTGSSNNDPSGYRISGVGGSYNPTGEASISESAHNSTEDESNVLLSNPSIQRSYTASGGGAMAGIPSSAFGDDSAPLAREIPINYTTQQRQQPKAATNSPFIEELVSGEYQTRFLMQVSLLEPIFTAPFASFDFAEAHESLLFDRAKTADFFSAGCLIYQLLSGTPLFRRDNIAQYLEGDGTWWWATASQAVPRRFKSLIFDLVMAGRPYFLYAIEQGLSLGYISKILSAVSDPDSATNPQDEDDPFDFGMALASNVPSSPSNPLATNVATSSKENSAVGVTQTQATTTIAITDLGKLSEGVLERFLNDDLIARPTSMKVFPSYFELVYQFLGRYHGTKSWKKRVHLALENIGFLVNLPLSGLDLILPDLLSFFDRPETDIEALALIEPLAIKMGKSLTIEKLLGPILSLYERMQRSQQTSTSSSASSTSSQPNTSNASTSSNATNDHNIQLALELLSSRFVHTILSKIGQTVFLKHIVGFLVNEVRSTKKEIGFAAGSALLRLVSILSPPIYIRSILYPLLSQLNKVNTEVLCATLVEIGARMGEDVIVRHHIEVIIPLLQLHIFQKEDPISIRVSITLLRLISSLVALLHSGTIISSMMVDHRCLFSILLDPPTNRGVWDALLECLSAVFNAIGFSAAIKYARPYVQHYFVMYGTGSSTFDNERPTSPTKIIVHGAGGNEPSSVEHIPDPFKTLYPPMVMMRFKDLLDIRSGGGNVSIQQNLGSAMRIESYLMGPANPLVSSTSSSHLPTASTLPTSSTSFSSSSSTSKDSQNQPNPNATTNATSNLSEAELQDAVHHPPTSDIVSPTPTSNSSTTSSLLSVTEPSDQNAINSGISPRKLSGVGRPVSPTLTALSTGQTSSPTAAISESSTSSSIPPKEDTPVLRLATANEDGHIADVMPNWLASMFGTAYTPAPIAISPSMSSTRGGLGGMPLQGSSTSTSSSAILPLAAPGVSPLGITSAMAPSNEPKLTRKTTSYHPSMTTGSSGTSTTNSLSSSTTISSSSLGENPNEIAAPLMIQSFGPPLPSPSGAGWPPTLATQPWNFAGQTGHIFKEHSSAIRCVSVHDNERLFLSGSKDTTVKCWDLLSEGSSRQTYQGHRSPVFQTEFVDRGNLVASCDGGVHVWELERGTRLTYLDASSVSSSPPNSNSAQFTCFTSHQDGRVLICGTSLSTVTFTDLRAEQDVVCEWYLPTLNPSISGSPSSSSSSSNPLASSGSSSSASLNANSSPTYPRALSLGHLDQNLLVVAQSSGHISLIDIRSGLLLHNWRAHDGPITSLRPVPDASGYLVSASIDKTIALWDIANANFSSPQGLTYFRGHSDTNIAFDIYRGSLFSVSGQKLAISPLFGQGPSVVLEKRKLLKTNALKFTNILTSFNILQSHQIALLGADDGSIRVTQ